MKSVGIWSNATSVIRKKIDNWINESEIKLKNHEKITAKHIITLCYSIQRKCATNNGLFGHISGTFIQTM
jgi:hypothetical protein